MVSNNNLWWLDHSSSGSGGFSPPCSYPNPTTVTEDKPVLDCSQTDFCKEVLLDVRWRRPTITIEIV